MRFLQEFDQLQEIDTPDGGDTNIEKLRYLFSSKGFQTSDPRIKDIISVIEKLESKGEDLNFEMFKKIIRPSYTFFRQILQNQLVIPDFENYRERVKSLYDKVKAKDFGGFIPSYIPQLAKADENGFAVSICTVSGQVINFGDSSQYVWMHHITSVVSYLNALEEHGHDVVSSYIGTEPSGKPFDSLELKNGIPHNPLISSGIMTWCSLLYQDETIDRKYEKYAKVVEKLAGGNKHSFNNEMYLSEIARSDRNYWLLYMLQEAGTLPPKSDVKEIIKFYTQTWSIELKVKDYAILAASLANGGTFNFFLS